MDHRSQKYTVSLKRLNRLVQVLQNDHRLHVAQMAARKEVRFRMCLVVVVRMVGCAFVSYKI